VPAPRQVFGIGLNYDDHATESGMELPPAPLTFTKFPSCIAGPTADVPLSGELVDWEAELVAVIGVETSAVPVDEAWGAVAGLMLGQDISDRGVQLTGSPAQFCLGKSFAAYGPTGPALVSVDSFEDPDDIALWCDVSGERMQHSRSRHLIFTGTPSGVGMARGRFLAPGDVVVTGAEVIGELRNPCVAGRGPLAL
jgi:2-keto-4-pentenoate hydratase/2-oxohepta-3-ene-1,7-dioic acid hydratase in catechol pathway